MSLSCSLLNLSPSPLEGRTPINELNVTGLQFKVLQRVGSAAFIPELLKAYFL